MIRGICFTLGILLLIVTTLPTQLTRAQVDPNPRLLFSGNVPGITNIKTPDIAAHDATVHVSVNINSLDAVYFTKIDTAVSFGDPQRIGPAVGQPDFSTTSIATGVDGSVHYAWINQEARTIFYTSKPAGGQFAAARTVAIGTFPVNIQLAVSSTGQIFIMWREPGLPFRVTTAVPGGAFSPAQNLGSLEGYRGVPDLAAGPNGEMLVAIPSSLGEQIQILAGFWNGTSFDLARLPTSLNASYSDPTATFDPDGGAYIAFRSVSEVRGDPERGAYVATHVGGNSWQVVQVLRDIVVKDNVNIDADPRGNLHLSFSVISDLLYSVRPTGGQFTSPFVSAPSVGGALFFTSGIANVSDRSYHHAIGEFFEGSSSRLRYFLFAADTAVPPPPIGAQPVIDDDRPITRFSAAYTVSFNEISGTPDQIRWRWGNPLTDTEDDSGGWQAFTNPMQIPDPAAFPGTCLPIRLYTQVRDSQSGATQAEQRFDDVIIDRDVEVAMRVTNPHLASRSPLFDDAVPVDFAFDSGASDGDPQYTRSAQFYLELTASAECSGLRSFAAGTSATTLPRALSLSSNNFASVLPFPTIPTPGSNNLTIAITDEVGNVKNMNAALIFDDQAPILNELAPGTLTVASNAQTTLIADLNFNSISVTDDRYNANGRSFWGVWVANSRSPVADPQNDPNLFWVPLRATGTGNSFTLSGWSLETGLLPNQVTPGDYYVYVRFLDGAGNPTTGHISAQVTLDTVSRTAFYLPLVQR